MRRLTEAQVAGLRPFPISDLRAFAAAILARSDRQLGNETIIRTLVAGDLRTTVYTS